LEHKAKIAGVVLLSFALSGAALTLGRIRGAALIGQPLDVAIQVQMDTGEEAAALCFTAEVFHADTLQDPSRVRVLVQAEAPAQATSVRVLSLTPIDEPVVTVYLHTGCGQKTTRRYVLLADLPSPVETPVIQVGDAAIATAQVPPPAALSSTAAATPVTPVGAALTTPTAPAQPVAQAKPTPVPKPVPKPTPAPKPALQPKALQQQPSAKADAIATPKKPLPSVKDQARQAVVQSRLRLDSVELLSDRVASLESATRAPPPQDIVRELQKLQALQADLTALRASAAKTEASLAELKLRLQKAEAQRFPSELVYAALALVLAALAALAWFWQRQRRKQTGSKDWWNGAAMTQTPPGLEAESQASEPASSSDVDVSMIELDDLTSDEPKPSQAPQPASHPHAPAHIHEDSAPPATPPVAEPPQAKTPPELDLDLSELESRPVQPGPALTVDHELPLPVLGAIDHPEDTARPKESDNLIDFDFLEPPKQVPPPTKT